VVTHAVVALVILPLVFGRSDGRKTLRVSA